MEVSSVASSQTTFFTSFINPNSTVTQTTSSDTSPALTLSATTASASGGTSTTVTHGATESAIASTAPTATNANGGSSVGTSVGDFSLPAKLGVGIGIGVVALFMVWLLCCNRKRKLGTQPIALPEEPQEKVPHTILHRTANSASSSTENSRTVASFSDTTKPSAGGTELVEKDASSDGSDHAQGERK